MLLLLTLQRWTISLLCLLICCAEFPTNVGDALPTASRMTFLSFLGVARCTGALQRRCLFAATPRLRSAITTTTTALSGSITTPSSNNSSASSSIETLLDDADKRIQLPHLQYGYRTEPMNWTEVSRAVAVDVALLSRSVQQQADYEIYKRHILKKWKSVLDHVLVNKLGLERRTDSQGLFYAANNTSSSNSGQRPAVLVKNSFPYYTTPEIEHYVLWKLTGGINEQDIANAKLQLATELADLVDTLHWINPVHVKSLPEIDHAHILCLRERAHENEI